jgi:hypothetical protein
MVCDLQVRIRVFAATRERNNVVEVKGERVYVFAADPATAVVHLKDNESIDTLDTRGGLRCPSPGLFLTMDFASTFRVLFAPSADPFVAPFRVRAQIGSSTSCSLSWVAAISLLPLPLNALNARSASIATILLPVEPR